MKVAIEGCCHGELDIIYETLAHLETTNSYKVDLLLICGDFQAVRNQTDLQCMAVPAKYRRMNTFDKYYSGEKTAPILTVFVGGNHEASNYMQSLPYGGWVAPNIYFLGYAGVVQFGGIRIAGLSGIYNAKDFHRGHHEYPPYTEDTKRSAYHVRIFDIFRLKQISRHVDIFLSHDWPCGVYRHGDLDQLARDKCISREEIETTKPGIPAAGDLLYQLQPTYWFAAHYHVKFSALIQHQTGAEGKVTKFLSLDKPLPGKPFLQVIDIPHDHCKPMRLELDPEWLAILKATNHLLSLSGEYHAIPGPGGAQRFDFKVTEEELQMMKKDFGGDLTLPENFTQTVPVFDPLAPATECPRANIEVNEQTTWLCSMLALTDPYAEFLRKKPGYKVPKGAVLSPPGASNKVKVGTEREESNKAKHRHITGDDQRCVDVVSSANTIGRANAGQNDCWKSVGDQNDCSLTGHQAEADLPGVLVPQAPYYTPTGKRTTKYSATRGGGRLVFAKSEGMEIKGGNGT